MNAQIKRLDITSEGSDLQTYNKRVLDISDARRTRISNAMSAVLDLPDWLKEWVIITTTGSDGRRENKVFDSDASNTEITVAFDSKNTLVASEIPAIIERIKSTASFTVDGMEMKSLGADSMTLFENRPDLVFPTRVWDATNIWGEGGIGAVMRRIVSEEIIQKPTLARRFYDRLRWHRRVLNTGETLFRGAPKQQFNLEEGVFHYDPSDYVEGVKSGPLRVVQYTLALGLMRLIRDTQAHPNFMDELPKNISERLDFLLDANLTTLSPDQMAELKYAYQFFLKMYHQMQYEYFTGGVTQFTVDKDRLNDIKSMLSFLTDTFDASQVFVRK